MIAKFNEISPKIDKPAFIAGNAVITGNVIIKEDANIWYGAVLRGDIEPITVGKGSNIQDLCILHTSEGTPCTVGDNVTVGHGVILHGCTVEDNCLIGMGATILDGAVIGKESIVGACALVTKDKVFPPRSMIIGSPAKAVRQLTEDEVAGLHAHPKHYVEVAKQTEASRS
ncbi:MAG: gamma carbonic anhydrase family protein [Spirochaetia bacterium]|nr:gamma carbonic anhydrase family protein [Spirochaetia bacterium]